MSYIDFGLTLAGMWFTTLSGAIALIIVIIEAFKRFGARSEESAQSSETKQVAEDKVEQLSEDEATTVVALAAVQAYLSEEQKEVEES